MEPVVRRRARVLELLPRPRLGSRRRPRRRLVVVVVVVGVVAAGPLVVVVVAVVLRRRFVLWSWRRRWSLSWKVVRAGLQLNAGR